MRTTLILGLVLTAGVFIAFQEADTAVDFSQPPKQGLKIKATKSFELTMSGLVGEAEAEITIDATMKHQEVFKQTFTSIRDGKVQSIEREYEESVSSQKMSGGMLPEPREEERESVLAWKHFRGTWKDDEFTLSVKDDDTWGRAEDKAKALLAKSELRSPLMPLPRGSKNVGDSWKIEMRPFVAGLFGGMQRNMPDDLEGDVTVKFSEIKAIKEYRDAKCAVLDVKFELGRESEGANMVWRGTFYYSLGDRVFLGHKGTGTLERDSGGQSLEGAVKSSAKVEIAAADQADD